MRYSNLARIWPSTLRNSRGRCRRCVTYDSDLFEPRCLYPDEWKKTGGVWKTVTCCPLWPQSIWINKQSLYRRSLRCWSGMSCGSSYLLSINLSPYVPTLSLKEHQRCCTFRLCRLSSKASFPYFQNQAFTLWHSGTRRRFSQLVALCTWVQRHNKDSCFLPLKDVFCPTDSGMTGLKKTRWRLWVRRRIYTGRHQQDVTLSSLKKNKSFEK